MLNRGLSEWQMPVLDFQMPHEGMHAMTEPEKGPNAKWASAFPELAWLFPPDDIHDCAAWERYWQDQASHEGNA